MFLRALHCQNEGRIPIWFMRQAGRCLPEYAVIKKNRSLLEIFHDPKTIAEITRLPTDLLNVDVAILFSDILMVLDGLGIRYDFQENVGPQILDEVEKISPIQDNETYRHIEEAIKLLKKEISLPILGFAGGPFTVLSYLIEKKSSHNLKKTKKWLYSDPNSFQNLLDIVTTATLGYLKCQEDAGVDAIQIFDSSASALGFWEFKKYCMEPMKKIVDALNVPVIIFCRGSSLFAREISEINPSAISIDWSGDLPSIRKQIPKNIALQGNLDPMLLYGSKKEISHALDRILAGMRNDPGYIFNLGHGLLPDTPVENVKFVVDYVRSAQ